MTSSNRNISALLALCAGNSPVTGEFPALRPVMRSVDDFFDLHPNERLSKQLWGWWFETPSCALWRHSNGILNLCRSWWIASWLSQPPFSQYYGRVGKEINDTNVFITISPADQLPSTISRNQLVFRAKYILIFNRFKFALGRRIHCSFFLYRSIVVHLHVTWGISPQNGTFMEGAIILDGEITGISRCPVKKKHFFRAVIFMK